MGEEDLTIQRGLLTFYRQPDDEKGNSYELDIISHNFKTTFFLPKSN